MLNYTKKYKKISKKNKTPNNPINCSICYDPINKKKNISILKCKHKFHSVCIAKWCREKYKGEITCPECRDIILPQATNPSGEVDNELRGIIGENINTNVIQIYRNDILELERRIVMMQIQKLYTILPSITLLLFMWVMSNHDDKYNNQMIILGFSLFLSGVICKK